MKQLELTLGQTGELLGVIIVSATYVQKWAMDISPDYCEPPFEIALGATLARILWTIKETEEERGQG